MKKSVSLIVALLLFVAVLCCGCGEQVEPLTAKQVLEQAAQKVTDSYEMKCTVNAKVQMSGMAIEIPMDMNIKVAQKDGAPVSEIAIKTTMLEQEAEVLMYIEGDTAYCIAKSDGSTVNYKTSSKDVGTMDFDFSDFVDANGNLVVSEESLTMTENEDGSKTLVFPMPTDMLNSLMQSANSVGGAVSATPTFKPTDMTLTVNKDGYFTKGVLKLEATMTEDMIGEVSYDMDFDMEYVNPGQPVTVTPPEGYQNFPSLSDEL